MPNINPLMNAVSELLYNRQHLDLHPKDKQMLEDAYLGVERELSEVEGPCDGQATPRCEKCGNDGSRASLYETIDAKWDNDIKGWVLEQREDDGGSEIDCLACDHRGESDGVFPYGAVVR